MKELDITKISKIVLFDEGIEENEKIANLKDFLRHIVNKLNKVEWTLIEPSGSLGKPFVEKAISDLRITIYEIRKELVR